MVLRSVKTVNSTIGYEVAGTVNGYAFIPERYLCLRPCPPVRLSEAQKRRGREPRNLCPVPGSSRNLLWTVRWTESFLASMVCCSACFRWCSLDVSSTLCASYHHSHTLVAAISYQNFTTRVIRLEVIFFDRFVFVAGG